MRISIVVIAAENGVIGKDNTLPWRLPDDLKRFKQLTLGNPVLMGRKTYESIGKPLPGRLNIVISRTMGFAAEGCVLAPSIDAALQAAGDAPLVSIVGGGDIYRQILPRVDTIHLTRVHASVAGDVFFPALDPNEWVETYREPHAIDERHAHAFTFTTLERKGLEQIK